MPDIVMESKQNMNILFAELKEKYNFPFEGLEFLSPQILQNYIYGLNQKMIEGGEFNDKLLKKQILKVNELMNQMDFYFKALYFYHEGEQYLRRLESLGWIIHYNDSKIFDTMYQEFREKWTSLTQRGFDIKGNEIEEERIIEMTFDKICIPNGELEYPNPAITAILKDNPEIKNEFPEKGVIFYLRGFQSGPDPMSKAIIIEFRWLDENGQKHIVWDSHLPYPLPIFLITDNTLY